MLHQKCEVEAFFALFHGYGFDLRRRKIWDDFATADLREITFNPETDSISDVNFLIGNHNDELTPWIPILAARKNCNFFLLPCCPYSFFGKFSAKKRTSESFSIYTSYLDFIRNICKKLGFVVQEDRLKIPSTKRHCFICSVPSFGLPKNLEDIVDDLLDSAASVTFVAREKVIQVRNNTHLPNEFRQKLTRRIFDYLLSKAEEKNLGNWCRGSAATLSEIAALLDKEEKTFLKNSDGGLQTFIKNKHQVFVVHQGKVMVRDWAKDCKKDDKKNLKTCPCFFQLNHPQGCPLPDLLCSYKH